MKLLIVWNIFLTVCLLALCVWSISQEKFEDVIINTENVIMNDSNIKED